MSYAAPLAEMRFVLEEMTGPDELPPLPGGEAVSPDLVDAVLGEAAKLAGERAGAAQPAGDRDGSVLENGVVRTPRVSRRPMPAMSRAAGTGSPSTPNMAARACRSPSPSPVAEMWNSAPA